jgi:hypothetical protein
MEGYRPETYGDRIADPYDPMTVELPDPADCVDRLAELAGAVYEHARWPPRSIDLWTGRWSWTTGGGGWRCCT